MCTFKIPYVHFTINQIFYIFFCCCSCHFVSIKWLPQLSEENNTSVIVTVGIRIVFNIICNFMFHIIFSLIHCIWYSCFFETFSGRFFSGFTDFFFLKFDFLPFKFYGAHYTWGIIFFCFFLIKKWGVTLYNNKYGSVKSLDNCNCWIRCL